MGVAAYRRGSRVVTEQIERDRRPIAFDLMDSLNAVSRHPDTPAPWGAVNIVPGHGGFWVECPITGHGYHYPSLRKAVESWKIIVVSYDETTQTWGCIPAPDL